MFYFAWTDEPSTAGLPAFGPEHLVQDEVILGFSLSHLEGEFPTLTIEVENPREGLLSPARGRWAWFSWDGGGTGAEPLFFGRVVGAPEGITEATMSITLIARPPDFFEQKAALAASMRVLPFYDPVWLGAEQREDPDIVLQARSALWHIDRLSLEVSASDIILGEVGPVELTHFRDNLGLEYVQTPGRQVKVRCEVSWVQTAIGSVNVTPIIAAAFAEAGAPRPRFISSYTGQGLLQDWPTPGVEIGGGWRVGRVELTRVDGILFPSSRFQVTTLDALGAFPRWDVRAVMWCDYEFRRPRTETVTFTVDADVQPLITGPDEEAPIEIVLSSSAVGELIDGVLPIGDLRRRSYFQTERGQRSIEHLICLARAQLLARARAVQITVDVPFEQAMALSCRHSVEVTDDRLPGGSAVGKVISYTGSMDGDSGELIGTVTLACTIGKGEDLTSTEGEPGYVEAGYVTGYQSFVAGDFILDSGDIGFEFYGSVAPNDDGVNFFRFRRDDAVLDCFVTNGPTTQEAALSQPFDDLAAAAAAANAVATTVTLQMRPLDGLSFSTAYVLNTTPLAVPLTINLEALA